MMALLRGAAGAFFGGVAGSVLVVAAIMVHRPPFSRAILVDALFLGSAGRENLRVVAARDDGGNARRDRVREVVRCHLRLRQLKAR